ncbi:MAG: hypothetical protein J3K34DRAFT_446046 [Monoraphidium minutum]|nr:MAG: hypothetical protein J3K34DRAFT_446046 [Monoraphidium minutum]
MQEIRGRSAVKRAAEPRETYPFSFSLSFYLSLCLFLFGFLVGFNRDSYIGGMIAKGGMYMPFILSFVYSFFLCFPPSRFQIVCLSLVFCLSFCLSFFGCVFVCVCLFVSCGCLLSAFLFFSLLSFFLACLLSKSLIRAFLLAIFL